MQLRGVRLGTALKILLASIAPRSRSDAFDSLAKSYVARIAPYTSVESASFATEAVFFQHLDKLGTRTAPLLVLLDSRGRTLTSEELASRLGEERDAGRRQIVFAIGPADGWSEDARRRAGLLLSFGRMTLSHQLMRVVLAEQVYRAFTILAGHPYHSGHSG